MVEGDKRVVDCRSLVAGSSSGYHLFALTPDDGLEEIYASRSGQEVCLVDRLFSSSLVAIVTVAAPRYCTYITSMMFMF